MLQKIMVGPFGASLLKDIKRKRRSIFLWTVNDEEWMKWSIKKEVDGVITDDPKKYLEVCDSYDGGDIRFPWRTWVGILWINALAMVFGWLFRWRYGWGVTGKGVKERQRISA